MAVTRSGRGASASASNSKPASKSKAPSEGRVKKAPKKAVLPSKSQVEASSLPKSDQPAYFLFKSEGESRLQNGVDMKFSVDDLANEPHSTTHWDGVRNYEARNTMMKMKNGSKAFFYHSNTKKTRPGIVGIVEVVREAYPDFTAWDKTDPHFDARSTKEDPKWFMVDVKLSRRTNRCITLDEIKKQSELQNMQLVRRGRTSVQLVTPEEWECILKMEEEEEEEEEEKK